MKRLTADEALMKSNKFTDSRIFYELDSIMKYIDEAASNGDKYLHYFGTLTEVTISELRSLGYNVMIGMCIFDQTIPYIITWHETKQP